MEQRLTWTNETPRTTGWYWMLNPHEEPGLPTIVQIERDSEHGRFIVLIPASRYPKVKGTLIELQHIDALWAGPLAIPSVGRTSRRRFPVCWEEDGSTGMAA
jgi:hypothetical protein